jgi:DNA-directed RNA polymerase sigma subunit (sigma70/sigma32)
MDRGEGRTLEEVGQYFNLTRQRIQQIEKAALAHLGWEVARRLSELK